MTIEVVTDKHELEEFKQAMGTYFDHTLDDCRETESDGVPPRKKWLLVEGPEYKKSYTAVDNSTGHFWTEGFSTLDGAMLYLTGVYTPSDDTPKDSWDYCGAVLERGGFAKDDEEENNG